MSAYRNVILCGDALATLRRLPDACVQMVCSSPPYFHLRDYGDPAQIGLEETPAEYVSKIVEVFREVRRVLRPDGTLWLNLGDSYSSGNSGQLVRDSSGGVGAKVFHSHLQPSATANPGRAPIKGMKPKNLLGMPWRVAFGLQDDGWILRSDIVWNKPNCLPASVQDRPTMSHEYVFLLAKSERYFYDADAIREPHKEIRAITDLHKHLPNEMTRNRSGGAGVGFHPCGRNKRSVWTINTQPFPEAHHAVMAPKLAELCILAGSSPMACEQCNAPWQRVTEQVDLVKMSGPVHPKTIASQAGLKPIGQTSAFRSGLVPVRETVGWEPTCRCENTTGSGRCLVLDPFSGAGTTAFVASRHGRDYLGIELNPEYCAMAEKRLAELTPGLWGFSEKAAQGR